MPHGMCFLWRPDVLALHVASDALIALAYFSIPIVLVILVRQRPDIPFLTVFWMFAAFIVSCGLTHVMSIVVIWNPLYWLEGVIKGATAMFSVGTALALVPLLPRALRLRSPADLERVNQRLQAVVEEKETLLSQYQREHHIASTLQNASLGTIPHAIGAIELSAVYRPAFRDMEIGGDWYDAFELPDGRMVVSIGDVAGKGLGASIIMAKMRQAIRVAAQVQVMPGAILDAADRALRLEHPDVFVTAFVAIVDDVEETFTYASAGHPYPLVRTSDGAVSELSGGGLPLGLRGREDAQQNATIALEPGTMVVLYTDGLLESTHDYTAGESRLVEAVRSAGFAKAMEPARDLHDTILFDGVADDVAILTLKVGAREPARGRRTFDVTDAAAAAEARDALAESLRQRGATDDDVFTAEVIFSELIGNVVRYAGGAVDVLLAWRSGRPVLHMLDRGPGFQYVAGLPVDMLSESGRGLFIIQQMSTDFAILRRQDGGSHARVVLAFVGAAR